VELAKLSGELEVQERRAKALDKATHEMNEHISRNEYGDAFLVIQENRNYIQDEAEVNKLIARLKEARDNEADFQKRRIAASIQNQNYDSAYRALEEARRKLPNLDKDWEQLEKEVRAAEKTNVVQSTRDATLRNLEEQFSLALQDGLFELAEEIVEKMVAKTPPGVTPKDYRKEINDAKKTKVQEYLSFGKSLENAGDDLQKALEYYEKAYAIAPGNPQVIDARITLQKRLKTDARASRHLDEATRLMAAGGLPNLKLAREELKTARSIDLGNEEIKRLLSIVEKQIEEQEKPQELSIVRITDSDELIAARKRLAPNRFVYIPGGDYKIGSDTGGANAKPEHIVHVDGFYILQYEVSVRQYKNYSRETGQSMPTLGIADQHEYLPMTRVSRLDAEKFAEHYNSRLPTELEWEIAARTIEGWEYTTGEQWNGRRVNHGDGGGVDGESALAHITNNKFADGWRDTGYQNGPRLLYHMGGNVSEWTSSDYKPYPNGSTNLDDYGKNYAVVRGGSYDDTVRDNFKTHHRRGEPAHLSFKSVGFRLARDP
jgi:formylglycine-generating enzyme required for sulfatase activity